ncbi:hypothetical protein, partial [Actinacidiphila glaucinigra]|uniref:hypothetical protein n=1 Tax=Actinacidiphila glaucinigra TaxID=235986 RepID=UPI0035E1CF20
MKQQIWQEFGVRVDSHAGVTAVVEGSSGTPEDEKKRIQPERWDVEALDQVHAALRYYAPILKERSAVKQKVKTVGSVNFALNNNKAVAAAATGTSAGAASVTEPVTGPVLAAGPVSAAGFVRGGVRGDAGTAGDEPSVPVVGEPLVAAGVLPPAAVAGESDAPYAAVGEDVNPLELWRSSKRPAPRRSWPGGRARSRSDSD